MALQLLTRNSDFYVNGDTIFTTNLEASGSATIPIMAGNPNFTGDIYQYGSITRNASFIDVVGNRIIQK